MVKRELNIAVAKACGWTEINIVRFVGVVGKPPKGGVHTRIPNYCSDHNAAAEMVTHLTIDEEYAFGEELRFATGNVGPKGGHFVPNGFGCFKLATATPEQRCIAFLKAKKIPIPS